MAPTNKKKWIDKKSATTFEVRYRSQKDPLIHDETATDFVFQEVEAPNSRKQPTTSSVVSEAGNYPTNNKIKTAQDLESELGINASKIRSNEGEAAMHGIYFDDTKYDYMQHMRDIGTTSEGVFIEAPQVAPKQTKWKKVDLAAALQAQDPPKGAIRLPEELLPSKVELKRTFQDQMDVPDALKGFQPDMDPRLREVLEALDDDAYVDDDEDIFGELAEGGEVAEGEFEEFWGGEEDDGWQSDATEKLAAAAAPNAQDAPEKNGHATTVSAIEEDAGDNQEWMSEFSKFKKAQKKAPRDDTDSMADTMSFGDFSMMSSGTMSMSGKRRRRREKKGTATSTFSMSSSALFRTEGLTLLDDRFERIEEEYANSDGDDDGPTETVPEVREDFNQIMDEFLNTYNATGSRPSKARVRRGKPQTGVEQLEEIRRDLGRVSMR